MSDEQVTPEDQTKESQVTGENQEDDEDEEEQKLSREEELRLLKERAKLMGIKFGGNIGLDALKDKVNNHLNNDTSEEEEEEEVEEVQEEEEQEEEELVAQVKQQAALAKPETKKAREARMRREIQAEALSLVRCRIYNLNPMKNDLRGEIITVGNKYVGTVRKMIPFGEQTDGGYHIPRIIFNHLKSRKFQQIRTKTVNGQIIVDNRMVPEYQLEELPPLTPSELKELAVKQAAAQRLGME